MKNYLLNFASGNPTLVTGLSPTFVLFAIASSGQTIAAPGISEVVSGYGLYSFQWGTTTAIAFTCDGATTGLGNIRYIVGLLDPSDRADEYGNTLQAFSSSLVSLGTSGVALGTSSVAQMTAQGLSLIAIGNTSIAYGGTILQDVLNLGSTLVAIGNSFGAFGPTITVEVSGIGSTASFIGNTSTYPVDLFGYLKRIDALIEGQQQFIKGAGSLNMYDLTGATLLSARTITNSASLVTKQ